MSYSTHESLEEIVGGLRELLPELQRLLHQGVEVHILHGTVEMLSSLVAL